MKRLLGVIVCAALLLAGCGPAAGTIQPREPSGDEAALLEMLAPQEIRLYRVNSGEQYHSLRLWAETYENGVLTNEADVGGVTMGDENAADNVPKVWQGDILISLTPGETDEEGKPLEPDGLRLAYRDETGTMSLITKLPAIGFDVSMHSTEGTAEDLAIAAGQDILLYAEFYAKEDGSLVIYNDQSAAQDPDFVKEYSAVRLVKCRFE